MITNYVLQSINTFSVFQKEQKKRQELPPSIMPDKRKENSEKTSSSAKKQKVNSEVETLTFDPVHFIRSHSKNNDPADIQTQIWEVVFEPDPRDPLKTTSKVATCGGNSICIVDVNTGTVLMKYKHKELK